jgi:hypothetical protein
MDRPDTIINLAGHVWASLRARGLARHDPLANLGQAGMVLIRAESSRARAGPARPAHLDIYSLKVRWILGAYIVRCWSHGAYIVMLC